MKPHSYYQAILDANEAAGRLYFHPLSANDARELLRTGIAAAPPPTDLPELRAVEDRSIEGPHGPIALRIDLISAPARRLRFVHAGLIGGTASRFHSR